MKETSEKFTRITRLLGEPFNGYLEGLSIFEGALNIASCLIDAIDFNLSDKEAAFGRPIKKTFS